MAQKRRWRRIVAISDDEEFVDLEVVRGSVQDQLRPAQRKKLKVDDLDLYGDNEASTPTEQYDQEVPATEPMPHEDSASDIPDSYYCCTEISCDFKTPIFSTLMKHEVIKHLEHKTKCYLCEMCMELGEICEHTNTTVDQKKKKENQEHCEICNIDFKSGRTLATHITQNHVKGPFCPDCYGNYTICSELVAHYKKKHHKDNLELCREEEKKQMRPGVDFPTQKCASCSFESGNKLQFSKHVIFRHVKTTTCPTCQQSYFNKTTLTQHFLKIHDGDINALSTELSKKGMQKTLLLSCKYCKKTYVTQHRLDYHIKVVHEKKPHVKLSEKKPVKQEKQKK